jgi:cellulose synthase/poly-beta-1,6-N-acetylglucosamine synthase-like glycosyltransferase
MLGATGAFYAIRRELFPQLPKDLILDDIYVPMKIVEKGYRAIFDKKAKVYDKVFSSPKEEFLRRTRTLAGNFQLFIYLRGLFNPLKGKISWQFFSHKFLRLMVPFFLTILFVSNLLIVLNLNLSFNLYFICFILQVIFYLLALIGGVVKLQNKLFDIPYMFCVMNFAALAGMYRFLAKKQDVTWEKAKLAL